MDRLDTHKGGVPHLSEVPHFHVNRPKVFGGMGALVHNEMRSPGGAWSRCPSLIPL